MTKRVIPCLDFWSKMVFLHAPFLHPIFWAYCHKQVRVLPWGVGKHQFVWFLRMSKWSFLVTLPQSGRMKNIRNHINWVNLNFLLILSQSFNWKMGQTSSLRPEVPGIVETSCLLWLSLGPLTAHHPQALLTSPAPESLERLDLELGRIPSPNKNRDQNLDSHETFFGLPSKLKSFLKVIPNEIHISHLCFLKINPLFPNSRRLKVATTRLPEIYERHRHLLTFRSIRAIKGELKLQPKGFLFRDWSIAKLEIFLVMNFFHCLWRGVF